MLTLPKTLRSALPAALIALTLATGAHPAAAQSGTTIQQPHALGLDPSGVNRYLEKPFNFTGRIFDLVNFGFGSGTLIRRHTVLTAGHVLYNTTTGFTTAAIFSRALYGNYSLSKSSIVSVAVLAGYQTATDTSGENSLIAFASDQGYVLLPDRPIDDDWANFTSDPTLLASPNSQFFVLGYPGITFDGRTLAYVVPMSPYVKAGTAGSVFTNEDYSVEPGMSGGPVYVETDNTLANATVAADTVAIADDSTGEGNQALVRSIDKTSNKFLRAAEYTSGLLKKVKVTGPATVRRGTTVQYTVKPVFSDKGTTDRYSEIKLKSSVPAIQGNAKVTVVKTSNNTFNVTFDAGLRPGNTTTLQAYYTGTATPLGKSSLVVKFQ